MHQSGTSVEDSFDEVPNYLRCSFTTHSLTSDDLSCHITYYDVIIT
jgi:hypothetical protein